MSNKYAIVCCLPLIFPIFDDVWEIALGHQTRTPTGNKTTQTRGKQHNAGTNATNKTNDIMKTHTCKPCGETNTMTRENQHAHKHHGWKMWNKPSRGKSNTTNKKNNNANPHTHNDGIPNPKSQSKTRPPMPSKRTYLIHESLAIINLIVLRSSLGQISNPDVQFKNPLWNPFQNHF